ncbi:MAG: DUF3298 and DUF4163 domain-containing protein [Clostridiales bacterium]|nr:DUF3298 and DUF4163 domain-containing protein [Clostridiales bacterium]
MKQILCLLLALSMTLALAACGWQATEAEGSAQSASSGAQPESSDTQPESSTTQSESAAAPESAAQPEESSMATAMEGVSLEDVTDDRTGEDGSTLLEFSYVVATVVVGDEVVTAAIQADLDSELDALLSEADGLIELRLEDDYFDGAYALSQTITVERYSGQVLSLLTLTYAYSGGAHGGSAYTPLCYDLTTGSRITLADLGDGVADTCADLVVQLCDAIQADGEGVLFDDYAEAVTDYVVLDGCFYLSEDGVVFLAGEYSIGPYAMGNTRFLISYNDLPELNPQYARETDAVTQAELADGSVYTLS